VSETARLRIDRSAVRWSAPEHERAGRPLLVLLHGYGSHQDDLMGLVPSLPAKPVIASLRAPIAEAGGYAWFSHSTFGEDGPTIDAADAAARAVLDWLDSVVGPDGSVGPHGQPDAPSVGLLGFSQGGAMVLQLMRTDPARFAYGVQLSGYVVAGRSAGDDELARIRPPVFWARGTADTVIEPRAIDRTIAWLPEHARADIRVYDGLTHGISPEELVDVSAFIRSRL
jgi:phospholipase/carboxylesterase